MTDAVSDLKFASEFPPATRDQWRKLVERALDGASFEEKLVSHSYDGIAIEPLYERDASAHPLASRAPAAPWQIIQRVDHPDPAAANALALNDLEGGATGLTLVCQGAAGAHGFGLDGGASSIARALQGIYLDAGVSLELQFGALSEETPFALAAFVRDQGLSPDAVDIQFGFDPLGAFAASGVMPTSWKEAATILATSIGDLVARGFKGPFAVADGRVVHEAGGSEAQELAFVLATAVAYLRAIEAAGVPLDRARGMIAFRLAADADQLLTMAKFRALRRLWARVEEACGLAPAPIYIGADTSFRMMSQRDPYVNILRATLAVFSAGLGGANAVTVLPHTSALGLPDAFARRIARNTQLILLEESHLAKVLDPAAGSGGIEAITDALARAAWELFQEIETAGGAAAVLESSLIQDRVAETSAKRREAIAFGRESITGTSAFPLLDEQPVEVLDVAKPLARELRSIGARCSRLARHRLAEPFEALRDASDRHLARTGVRPRVFLATLGNAADFTARAAFAKNLFESGGIEAVTSDAFADPSRPIGENDLQDLTDAFKTSGAQLACLCSSDEVYPRMAGPAAEALAKAGAKRIYLAGRAEPLEAELNKAGIRDFIGAACNVIAGLSEAYDVITT